jgi:hypothetical protein
MRIIVNVKEQREDGKIGIEAKLDTGRRDTARERLAGEALFNFLGNQLSSLEQTAAKADR